MRTKSFILPVLIGAAIIINHAEISAAATKEPLNPNLDKSNEFDWKLLKAFSLPQYGNVILSPLSLKLVMAMLYEGSGGNTRLEMENTLGWKITDKTTTEKDSAVREYYTELLKNLQNLGDDIELNIGMRVYLDKEFKAIQKFAATAQNNYNTTIEPTDFEDKPKTAEKINAWIEEVTKGNIKKLVKEDDLQEAIMLITNAIYFKGQWKNAFPEKNNHMGGFYVSPKQIVQVPYMTTINRFYFMESEDLEAKILRMQYKGYQFSMYVVLPNAKSGLNALLQKFNLNKMRSQFSQMQNTTVEVIFPKVKFQFGSKLSKTLQDLGITHMFQNTASFPGINREANKNRRLVVTDISQKSGIVINEEGTEAYAATDITIGNKFGETDEIFNVTNPFLFYILHEKSQTVMFMGKVENPLNAQVNEPAVQPIEIPSRLGEHEEESQPIRPESGKKPTAKRIN